MGFAVNEYSMRPNISNIRNGFLDAYTVSQKPRLTASPLPT
jgi:hypothetical protein